MKVAVVAGEASGDRQAANLLQELTKQMHPGDYVDAWGIGGPCLAEAGCELIADSRSWGTIGIVNSLNQPINLFAAMLKFKKLFKARRPQLLILVDFGAFNLPIARWVKKVGNCKILYYFPPSSWRRQLSEDKLTNVTSVTDLIITPFSWSAELLRSVGGNAHFVGHPLLDFVQASITPDEFDNLYGLDRSKAVITLLPGSREHEVQHILPVLLLAAGEIARRHPGVQFLVAKSPNLPREMIERLLKQAQDLGTSASLLHLAQQAGDLLKHASSALKTQMPERVSSLATPDGVVLTTDEKTDQAADWAKKRMMMPSQTAMLAIVENATYDAMLRADLVIAASGTATLEAAILGRPPIIVYRGSSLMNVEYKIRKKWLNLEFIGAPNILANRLICPEFIQEAATASAIANKALEMILEPEQLMQIKAQLQTVVRGNLGKPGATQRAASIVIEYMRGEGKFTETSSPVSEVKN